MVTNGCLGLIGCHRCHWRGDWGLNLAIHSDVDLLEPVVVELTGHQGNGFKPRLSRFLGTTLNLCLLAASLEPPQDVDHYQGTGHYE